MAVRRAARCVFYSYGRSAGAVCRHMEKGSDDLSGVYRIGVEQTGIGKAGTFRNYGLIGVPAKADRWGQI